MANLNRVLIIGRCTRDPEMRYTPRGVALAEIGVAVSRVWKDESGGKREENTFIDCTLWGRLAEVAQQYLKKGSPVFLEGRLQMDSWEKDGQKHSKLKVVAGSLQLLGRREEGDPAPAAPRPTAFARERSQPVSASKAPGVDPELNVDAPF
jgi:single-strand DNA-binding protein